MLTAEVADRPSPDVQVTERLRRPGETALLRGVREGYVRYVQPTTVVSDATDLVALAMVPGSRGIVPDGYEPGGARGVERAARLFHAGPEPRHKVNEWRWTRVLIVLEPELYYAVHHFFDADGARFLCWYVNFQLPFKRSPLGFDTRDLALDLVVRPDREWSWKDEDEFAYLIEQGWISREHEERVRAAGDEVLRRIESAAPPFDGRWLDHRLDAYEPILELEPGWDAVAGSA